jgi:YggT family protein
VLLLANVLMGLAQVLSWALWFYELVLIGYMIISWVNADPRNPIVNFLHAATDPALRVIRRRLPMSLRYFPIDIAFVVLFGLVIFAQYGLVQSLVDYANVLHGRSFVSGVQG